MQQVAPTTSVQNWRESTQGLSSISTLKTRTLQDLTYPAKKTQDKSRGKQLIAEAKAND